MYDAEIQAVLDKINIFEKMYEIIRIVDPTMKKVITLNNGKLNESEVRCFDFWKRNKICDNCISIRALNENKTIVKIEYVDGKIYVITAVPVELSDRRVVLELLKDGTDSLIFTSAGVSNENKSEIYVMIDNMNNLAMKDALTGVYNRRYINEKLPIDLVSSALSGQRISIIMADIDFFKKVNDTYGHLVGDETLKSFADTINGCMKRESDWVGRFGGEEFLICLPGASVERAAGIAESMRKAVADKYIRSGEHALKITASFGICCMQPNHSKQMGEMIQCADQKLYLAKNNGRNRVEY